MPGESETSFADILRVLAAHRVEFIFGGGVSAVLQGVPMVTSDLDVVHSRTPDNVEHLLSALKELHAYYRIQPDRRIPPAASHLIAPGRQLLMTRYGPLDLLGEIGRGRAYADLLGDVIEFMVEPGVRVRVLSLRMLIDVKKETAGEKDLAALPLLERTLDESGRV